MPRLILILLLMAVSLPARAQAPVEEPFSEEIEVSVVNLDVFVADKQGKPLEGLKAEDFEVTEDGRPVKISNFYTEKRDGAPAAAGKDDRPQDQRLRLVVFIDDVNIGQGTRASILDRLSTFLHQELTPGDEVMLVRYAQSLDIRRSFTSDLSQIDSAVTELKGLSSDMRKFGESRDHAFEDIIDAIYANEGFGPLVEGRIRAWAEQESAVVRGALGALDGVVSWLAGVPGRKAVLYVSDGLPLRPGDDLFQWAANASGYKAGRRISGMTQGYDLSKRFRAVTSHASRNRIAFYPIEAYGARVSRSRIMGQSMIASRQDGLRFLAQDTGGREMLNAGDPLAALRLMGEDLTSYYSLGYTPDRPGDEAEHKIEVKVKVKGARARYRQWYSDKPAGEAVAERTLAVMRFGPEDNPLGASLEIQPSKEQNGTMMVPVRVKVPIAKLYLQPKDNSRTGRLRLYIVASTGGTTTPVKETKVVTVELPETEAAAGSAREYVHDVGIPLKAGAWSIGVAVRDELAATTSYLRKEFTVPVL
jgi:VWFA-related protein